MDLEFIVKGIIFKILQKFLILDFTVKEIDKLFEKAKNDAISFSQRDPAANGDASYVALTCSSYYAVISYRVASCLYKKGDVYRAQLIADSAKILTGIEIHPACQIGRNFVIDHGFGTVIGETSIIGDDCYILQCVVIGANKIANNARGKRHPTIGNNVEIAGFVNILGNISIGNYVKICSWATITESLPAYARVIRVSNGFKILKGLVN